MALSYVGGASGSGTGATYAVSLTSLTGGSGSAPIAGDLVIVVTGWAATANGDPGVDTAGYTEEVDIAGNDTRDANLSVSWKIMGGTPDTSVTVRGFNNAANGGATVVHVWRGHDATTPIDVTSTTAIGNNSAQINSPSITPVTTGAVVLSCGVATGDTTPQAKTAPTGYTNARSQTGAGSTMSAIACIASKDWSGSGAEDPDAWSGGETTTSDSWAGASIVIRPFVVTGPSLVSATMEDADRNYETFDQDITLTFSEAVEIVPAPSVGDTIAGLTAEVDFSAVEDPVKYVSGNGTTVWKVRIVPAVDEIFSSIGTVLIDYVQASGSIVTVSDGTEIAAFTDFNVVNNLSTIIWERIKNKDGVNLNAVEVRYALYHRNTDTITDADWMTLDQKGTLTTTADGIVSFAYTGASGPGTSGGRKYLCVMHPHSAPTESMIWFVRLR